MKPAMAAPRLLTLVLLTGLSTLSLNMFLPSLPSIAGSLGSDYATVSLAVAGYLATTAIVQLVAGPLSDRYGRRPVLLVALCIFIFAAAMCALAETIWMFLAFRMLQGAIISGYALSLAIVRDTTGERQAASLIGYISMAMALAPMLGPILGGLIDAAFGWRANFWFYAIAGAALLFLCLVDLGETRVASKDAAATGIGRASDLLSEGRFWGYAVCSAFSTGAFYVFLTGAPLVARVNFGTPPEELGVYLGSITAGFMAGGYLSGRMATSFRPTTMMLAGRVAACLGLAAGLALTGFGILSPFTFFGSTILVGLGNGLTMPSSNAGALSVRPDLAGTAAGVNGALIVALGALLTSAAGAVMEMSPTPQALLATMLALSLAGALITLRLMSLELPEDRSAS